MTNYITYVKAKSEEQAIFMAVTEDQVVDLILKGGTISTKAASIVPGHVCTSNSDSDYSYRLEDDQITSVTFNVHKSKKQFTKQHLNEFLDLHF